MSTTYEYDDSLESTLDETEESLYETPEEASYYGDEMDIGEVCEDISFASPGEMLHVRVCGDIPTTSRARDDDVTGDDVINFELLSKDERLLPLMYVIPLSEQYLILKKADMSGFRAVQGMEKVMDRVLLDYIRTMEDGPIKNRFKEYAEQRNLNI